MNDKKTPEEETWKRIWKGEGRPPAKEIREFIITRTDKRKGAITIREKK